ncbi:hypothetical protein SAMN05443144_11263 [Fodinibius roseus]|uniref:Uncharacterized protein n=1 Tax=Fodinibius roseus TaxID=1194090 RepID=A0A1M5DXR1_9BACT|nr:hypothetical protein SAMN05443144_11263 [Fodinibius roseus]
MNVHGVLSLRVNKESGLGDKPLLAQEAVKKVLLPLLRRVGSTSTKSRLPVELVFSVSKANAGPHLVS